MEGTRVLLWDIDGTLLDFDAAERIGIRKSFEHFALGPCTDEMLAAYSVINTKHWERLERGECTKHETMVERFVEFFARYGIATNAERFNDYYQHVLPETVVFRPNGWETVQALQKKYRQYCITNGNLPVQRKKLHDSGLDTVFCRSFISDEVGHEKPSLAFFQIVLNEIDVKPEEAFVIGDSLTSDIRGANNANIPCCWYNPSGKPAAGNVKIDYEIRDLAELISIL